MKAITIFLIIFLFSVNLVSAAWYNPILHFLGFGRGDIGYEYIGEFLHTWNNNPLGENESNIWFNSSAKYLQFFNGVSQSEAESRARWLTHGFGLARYNPNLEIITPDFNPTHSIYSDNLTEWNSTLEQCYGQQCYGFKRGQFLNSTYMTNSLWWDISGHINYDAYFVWSFNNISIENDDVDDEVTYCNIIQNEEGEYINRCDRFKIGEEDYVEVDNVTQFFITDEKTDRGHEVQTPNSTRLIYFNATPMLVSPVNSDNGYNQLDFFWIDNIDNKENLTVDKINEVSGYMALRPTGFNVLNNTDAHTGYATATGIERRGVLSFNVSSTPKYIKMNSMRLWHQLLSTQPVNTPPDNWVTSFWTVGNNSIRENEFNGSDWNTGNYTGRLVDWDADGFGEVACGGNAPCTTWVTIFQNESGGWMNNRSLKNFEQAYENDYYYSIILRDNSTYSAGQRWFHVLTVVTTPADKTPVMLELNYTLLNMTMDVKFNSPANNTEYFMSGLQMQVNLSVDTTGLFNMSWCDFDLNGTVFRNVTTQQNGTISQNFTIENRADNYTWNVTCRDERGLYNSTLGQRIFNITENIPPQITFGYQDPPDIDLFNLFTRTLNITYNVSDSYSLISNVNLSYKTNVSGNDCLFITNGTATCGWSRLATNSSGYLENYSFYLDNNDVYPATYNLPEETLENTIHSIYILDSPQKYIKIEILNVSKYKNISIFEFMANNTYPTGTRALRVYYCNSSYVSGTPIISDYCLNLYNLPAQADYNHSHSEYSSHQAVPFTVNITSGLLGAVGVSNTSYFLLRGEGGINSWNVSYVTDISRPDAIQTSGDNGITWTNFAGTVDSHLHQYNGSETFYYYACANDTLGNGNCTTIRNDLIQIRGLPPVAPNVYSPTNKTYENDFIWINYTEAISPNGYDIVEYNISLLDANQTYLSYIVDNNLSLSYYWNINGTIDGQYVIEVNACDIHQQCSFGLSENFTIKRNINSSLNITLINPLNNSYYIVDVLHNNTIINFSYNVSSKYNISNCTAWFNITSSNYTKWNTTYKNYTNYSITPNITNQFPILMNLTGNISWYVGCGDIHNYTTMTKPWIVHVVGHEPFVYGAMFIAICSLIVVGERKKNWILMFLAGTFMLAIGVYTFINGVPGYSVSWFDVGYSSGYIFYFSMILMGLGLFYIFKAVIPNLWGFEEDGD